MFDIQIGNLVLLLARQGAGGAVAPLGSCFAVDKRRFATAAHVVGPSDTGLVAIVGQPDALSTYQDTVDIKLQAVQLKMVSYNPVYDIAILELVDPLGSLNFTYTIGGTDQVSAGTSVVSLGYPHADHGRFVLTQQASMVGARVLLGASGIKVKHAVLNTQTRPGQSGGPVFTANGEMVCAMITGGYAPAGAAGGISLGGIDPQTLHQTTHAVSAEYIRELL